MSRLANVAGGNLGSEETALEGFGSGRREGVASYRPPSPKRYQLPKCVTPRAFPSTAVGDSCTNSVVAEVI